jgi:hypothetical protein
MEPVRAVGDDGRFGREAEIEGFKHAPKIGVRRRFSSLPTSLRAVHLAQQMTSFPVDEMQPSASLAGDGFIFVVSHIFILVQPMLDLPVCPRTSEHNVGHPWRCLRHRANRVDLPQTVQLFFEVSGVRVAHLTFNFQIDFGRVRRSFISGSRAGIPRQQCQSGSLPPVASRSGPVHALVH